MITFFKKKKALMADLPILKNVLIILAIIIPITFLANRLRFPTVIGFLFTGVIIGPNALGWVQDQHAIQAIAEFGVMLLLFSVGLEFSLEKLFKMKRILLIAGGGQVFLTVGFVWLFGLLFGMSPVTGFIFGSMIALSSTAIVLKILGDKREIDSPIGRLTITICLFQDLFIVPLMLMIPYLNRPDDFSWLQFSSTIALSITGIIMIILIARIVIPNMIQHIIKQQNRELFFITIIFITIGTAWLCTYLGLSLAIGAFFAGLVISESEYSHQITSDILPIKDILMAVFFISIGMMLDLEFSRNHYIILLGLLVAIVMFKTMIIFGLIFFLKYPARLGIGTGLTLSQVGEFSFVIAIECMHYNLLTHEMYQTFLGASILTMTISPFLINWSDQIGQFFQKIFRLPDLMPFSATKLSQLLNIEQQAEIPSKKWNGHVVIIGYGTTGEYLSNVLAELGLPIIIGELIYDRYRKAKAAKRHTVFGDASAPVVSEKLHLATAKLLIISASNRDSALRIIKTARELNPEISIIARTRRLEDIETLHGLGANMIIPEELETTIEILALALRQFRIPRNVIATQVAMIRQDHYKPFLGQPVSESTLTQLPYILSASTTESGILLEHSPVIGKTLDESGLVQKTGIKIIAIVRDGKPAHQPPPDFLFQKGDIIIILGTHAEIDAALGMIGCEIVS